jgi:hypothetical protein
MINSDQQIITIDTTNDYNKEYFFLIQIFLRSILPL